MLAHTKTHLTDKIKIKNKIRADISVFKNYLVKKIENDDLAFIKEIQDEFKEILQTDELENIPAEEVFHSLTQKYSKAGALLKGLRIREGLSQTQFAKIIATTQANLSSMENGKRLIGKNKAKLIAEKFDVDYRYFL